MMKSKVTSKIVGIALVCLMLGSMFGGLSSTGSVYAASSYDPQAAVNYAEARWNGRNPAYHDYGDYDCANFVSQCLIAGGLDLSAGPGVDDWGCIPSVTNLDYNLRHYQNTQYQVGGSEPSWVVKGDPILFYSNDGTHHHCAFGVIGDASHYWHGNAHSIDCYHKSISWFLSDPNLDYCVYFHIKGSTPVQPPYPPTLTSPGSSSSPGPEIQTLTPTFQWSEGANADYYGLYIRNLDTGVLVFDSEVDYGPIYGTSFVLPESKRLEYGTHYRWNMASHNSAGWSYDLGTGFSDRLWFTTGEEPITDQQKQQEILNMVNNHRGSIPAELVLGIIRQEGGEGAFHVDGWNYNSFYRESDGPWAQPMNGDGIMQVTAASGYHERSGLYTHDRVGYDHAINDGCDYLLENYNTYGSYLQTTLHYNTGPNSLYIYLGKNWGDRNYLSHVAGQVGSFVPNTYGLQEANLVDALNQGQDILNDYLYNKGIATGQSVDYYQPYQDQLDNDLYNVEYPDTTLPTVNAFSVEPDSVTLGNAFTISYTVSDTGGSGLNRVELWQKSETVGWQEINRTSLAGVGNGPYSGSFSDAPSSIGTYWYGIHVVDNAGNWAPEDSPIEVQVIKPNSPPRLSNGYVEPASGTPSTDFYYYVTYFDPDGDNPSVKQVIIDGTAYTMSEYLYEDSWITYRYGPKNLSAGETHYYFFYFEDGRGGTTRLPSGTDIYLGPSVTPEIYPPQVTTTSASSITTSSATLNGNLDSTGGLDCEVWFEWWWVDETGLHERETPHQSMSSAGPFSAGISDLSPGETHNFRAYASNSEGTSYGLEDSFTTLAPEICIPSEPIDFGDVSVGDLTEEWLEIWNLGTATLTINSVTRTSGSSDFSTIYGVTPFDIEPGTEEAILILFDPSSEGQKNATFTINSNDPHNPNVTFDVLGNGVVAPNQPPNQPSNISPTNGATVTLTPTLQSSAFSDPDVGNIHAASHWQITTTQSDYSSPVFDSGVDATNLTSITIPAEILDYATTCYWHIRHQDNHGAWSDWSEETSFTTTSAGEVVTFPDPNLEVAIRETIGKPSGDIYQSDLEGLTELSAYRRGISDLTGLEYCINLEYLVLTGNQISDISPVSNLTSLTQLHLQSNQISDISSLSNLTNLWQLGLGSNQITNLQPLSSLIHLSYLYLDNNQISDISLISNLIDLKLLGLARNQISDISPMSNFINLESLDLQSNHISSISSLAGLINLQSLWLLDNQVSDINALSKLTEIKILLLDNNQIANVASLSGLTKLGESELYSEREGVKIYLGLQNNQISDILPLVDNEGLGEGDGSDLRDNPLSEESLNTYIPQLEGRGVNVLYDITGTVTIQGEVTLEGASDHSGISIEVWLNGLSDNKVANTTATSDGSYQVSNVPSLSEGDWYAVEAFKDGYAWDSRYVSSSDTIPGAIVILSNMVLHTQKWVSFDWVYQSNGTTNFTTGDLPKGSAILYSSVHGLEGGSLCGFIFSTSSVTYPVADVYFGDSEEHPFSFWANNGLGGIHDMGAVALESVIEAPDASNGVGVGQFYNNQATDVIVGHSYCIVTKDGIHYAKIYVTDVGSAEAPPRTWYVDDDLADYADADFTKIQGAIGAASAGDTIIVYAGTYTENVDVNKDQLTIRSENGAEATIVQAASLALATFEVAADNATITGFTVAGAVGNPDDPGFSGSGIALNSVNGCNISNNILRNNTCGIELFHSSSNTIESNEILGGSYAIIVSGPSNANTIQNNICRDNSLFGICIDPDSSSNYILGNALERCGIVLAAFDSAEVEHLTSHTIDNNRVNGKPVYYYKNTEGTTVPEDAGQVIIVNCSDMVVKNTDAFSASIGIQLAYTDNSVIENNDCISNLAGIALFSCSDNILRNNTANDAQEEGCGIYLGSSNNNILANNTVLNNYIGIVLYSSSNNTITDNNASSNGEGIYLYYSLSTTNTLINNNVSNNNYRGIELEGASNNTISNNIISNNSEGIFLNWNCNNNVVYLNNFINNTSNVNIYGPASANTWNSPEEITYTYNSNTYTDYLGSYWSDYTGSDTDGDGIGDTPHSIDGDSDDHPLIEPFEHYVVVSPVFEPMDYDADGDGEISKAEATSAVVDYFDGTITKEQALEVIALYFG